MVPLSLLAHELAHGMGAFLADAECCEFAIQQTKEGARCTTRMPPVALPDQFSEVAAGPLLDLMLAGKLSPAADVGQAAEALNVWMRGLQEAKIPSAMDSDAARAFRFGRCLDGAEAFSALQCALTAAVLAHGAYKQHGAHLWLVAARLGTLRPEQALAFQANDIVNLLEHKRPLPLREVVLRDWLAGSEERANEAMAVEAELVAVQLDRGIIKWRT
ncbi:hypothetical protein [Qipengyuania gaetbuli]|uniref:hypothetical protein n=1 Tax=Qipengyuania gaetbuli TaxID=266952 RepID=UPI001CFE9E0F|nr:hypothetical protein [Qipengyuania gaetbuli]